MNASVIRKECFLEIILSIQYICEIAIHTKQIPYIFKPFYLSWNRILKPLRLKCTMGWGRIISRWMLIQKIVQSNVHFAIHWNADMSGTAQFFLQRNMICLFNISWKNNQMQTFADATNTTKLPLKLSVCSERKPYFYLLW